MSGRILVSAGLLGLFVIGAGGVARAQQPRDQREQAVPQAPPAGDQTTPPPSSNAAPQIPEQPFTLPWQRYEYPLFALPNRQGSPIVPGPGYRQGTLPQYVVPYTQYSMRAVPSMPADICHIRIIPMDPNFDPDFVWAPGEGQVINDRMKNLPPGCAATPQKATQPPVREDRR